jgi:hypothetical protein
MNTLTPLQERRLAELKQVVAARAVRRAPALARRTRGRFLRPAIALVTAAAGIAIGLVATGGGGTPAFAVTKGADGIVTITISEYADTSELTAELKHLDLPAAVVYVPANESCYQAHAYVVKHHAKGLYTVAYEPGLPTTKLTFNTRLLRPGQSIIFGIGNAAESGFLVEDASVFVVTGRLTACQYYSEPGIVIPASSPIVGRPTSTSPVWIGRGVDNIGLGNIRFPNYWPPSGK